MTHFAPIAAKGLNLAVAMATTGVERHVLVVSPRISGSKGFQKELFVPEVGQFIEAYSVNV